MAQLALVYGMRLLPADELEAVGAAEITLKDGRKAQVTMHLLEGGEARDPKATKPIARRLLRVLSGNLVRRRKFLKSALLAAAVSSVSGQGVATRGVKPQPRGKPSGLPFAAHFVDIGVQAGLTHPVIYGGVDRKDFIIETVGCGCAFIDYR